MKTLLILACALSTSAFAGECTSQEAQFIAKVGKINYDNADGCNFDLDYSGSNAQFTSSMVCPLDVGTVTMQGVTIEKNSTRTVCPFKTGDDISGYLFRENYSGSAEVLYEM